MSAPTCFTVSPDARRAGRLVALATLIVYLTTTGGSMATDPMSYEVTKSLVESRTTAMSFDVFGMEAHRGIDGRHYSPYGLGHPLYSVPFYAIGRGLEAVIGPVGRSDAVRKAAFVAGSAVATALVVWIVFLFAVRLTGHPGAAVWTALAVGFGTLLWPYSKFGFNAPLAALMVIGGVYASWTGVRTNRRRMIALGGLGLGGALLVRHELGLVGLVVAVWAADEYHWARRRLVRIGTLIGLPVAIAVLIGFLYNLARFGTPWDTGYLRDATQSFNAPWSGLVGLLVSPGRSLFLYSLIALPGVIALVRLFRTDGSTARLLAGVSAALFLFYASLTWWDADRSYGPRYLVPIIPLLCVPLAPMFAAEGKQRSRLIAVLALSVLMQLPGVLVDFSKAGTALGVTHPIDERRWNWRVVGPTVNARAIAEFLPDNVRYLTGTAVPPAVRPGEARDTSFSEQFGYSLDFWWLYLFYMGKWSAGAALSAALSLVAMAGFVLWRVRTVVAGGDISSGASPAGLKAGPEYR